MHTRSSTRPKDINQLAKLVIDIATGQVADDSETSKPAKNPAAVSLGRLGGRKGGKARAEKLSPEQRSEIARKAAQARYGKKPWSGTQFRVLDSEYPPLLLAGFHVMDVAGLRRLCVDRFPLSISRRSIMNGLEAVFQHVMGAGLVMQAWVDGSFLTEKLNPRDSDVAFRVARADWMMRRPFRNLWFSE
jgi:hypothetical protein